MKPFLQILLSQKQILVFRDISFSRKYLCYTVGLDWKWCIVSFEPPVTKSLAVSDMTANKDANVWLDLKMSLVIFQMAAQDFVFRENFFGGLRIWAKQVTCTSVINVEPQGNNLLFYGYIREMAWGQTKLSIFNVCVCVCEEVDERETERN